MSYDSYINGHFYEAKRSLCMFSPVLDTLYFFLQITHNTVVVDMAGEGNKPLLFTQTKFTRSSPSVVVTSLHCPPLPPSFLLLLHFPWSHNLSLTASSVLKYLTKHSHHLPSKSQMKKIWSSLDTFYITVTQQSLYSKA